MSAYLQREPVSVTPTRQNRRMGHPLCSPETGSKFAFNLARVPHVSRLRRGSRRCIHVPVSAAKAGFRDSHASKSTHGAPLVFAGKTKSDRVQPTAGAPRLAFETWGTALHTCPRTCSVSRFPRLPRVKIDAWAPLCSQEEEYRRLPVAAQAVLFFVSESQPRRAW